MQWMEEAVSLWRIVLLVFQRPSLSLASVSLRQWLRTKA